MVRSELLHNPLRPIHKQIVGSLQITSISANVTVSPFYPQSKPELVLRNRDFTGHSPVSVKRKKGANVGCERFYRHPGTRNNNAGSASLRGDTRLSFEGMNSIEDSLESALQSLDGDIGCVATVRQYFRNGNRRDGYDFLRDG